MRRTGPGQPQAQGRLALAASDLMSLRAGKAGQAGPAGQAGQAGLAWQAPGRAGRAGRARRTGRAGRQGMQGRQGRQDRQGSPRDAGPGLPQRGQAGTRVGPARRPLAARGLARPARARGAGQG